MKAFKIDTKEFNFLEIYSCTIVKRVNKHATATVIGLMKDSEEVLYKNLDTKSWETIYAYDIEGSKQSLFEGIIYDVSIKVTGDVRIATIHLIGGTYLLDQNEITRSYQDERVSYTEIMQEKFQHYKASGLLAERCSKPIGKIKIQYKETDWEYNGFIN